jgi:hypothetical protein
MANTPYRFFLRWNHFADAQMLLDIRNHFSSQNCPTLGDLNFRDYSIGIRSNEVVCENGIYIFLFEHNYYVGKATSCTLIERLAKHYDSRRVGGFNGLLKRLAPISDDQDNYIINQDALMSAKSLLIPIDKTLLDRNYSTQSKKDLISVLEMDLLIKLGDVLNFNGDSPTALNKAKKSSLSGIFF